MLLTSPNRPRRSSAVASTWDTTKDAGWFTFSNGNKSAVGTSTTNSIILMSNTSKSSGKLYAEYKLTSGSKNNGPYFVYVDPSASVSGTWGGGVNGGGGGSQAFQCRSNFTALKADSVWNFTNGIVAGDVIGCAIDFTAANAWWSYNNTWLGSGVPSTGTLPDVSFTFTPLCLGMYIFSSETSAVWTLAASSPDQTYSAPSGFSTWDGF